MIPLSLTIENINSFAAAQTMDFTAFGGNLFCITGKTGSGKTTVYDCIALSLYGKMARAKAARDFIRHNSEKGRVKFVFKEGEDVYTVEREFSQKAAQKAKLYKNGAIVYVNETEKINSEIRKIIDIEEDEFTTVVMLRQGKYERFLTSTSAAQIDTVGKIFKLGRFDNVYNTLNTKKGKIDERVNMLSQRLDSMPSTSKEQKQIAEKVAELEKKIAALKTEKTLLSKRRDALEKTRDLHLSFMEAAKNIERDERQLQECQAAIDAIKTEKKELERGRETHENNKKESEVLAAKIAVHRKQQDELNELKKEGETLLEKNESLRIEEDALSKRQEKLTALNEEIASREKALCALLSTSARHKECADAAKAYDALIALKPRYQKCMKDLQRLKDEKKSIVERTTKKESELAATKKGCEQCEKELANREKLLERAKEAYEKKRVQSGARYIAEHLCDGDTCPVCGGTYREHELTGVDTQAEKEAQTVAQNERDKALKTLEDMKGRLNTVVIEINNLNTDNKKNSEEIDRANAELKDIGVDSEYFQDEKVLSDAKAEQDKLATVRAQSANESGEVAKKRVELVERRKSLDDAVKKNGAAIKEIGNVDPTLGERAETLKKAVESFETKERDLEQRLSAQTATEKTLKESIAHSAKVKKPEFDENEYVNVKNRLEEIAQENVDAAAQLSTYTAQLEAVKKELAEKKKLSAELSGLKEESALYDRLCKLTHGKGLLKFVAYEYIQAFTERASAVLNEISMGKYTMCYRQTTEGDDKDGFYVREYTAGGYERSVSSLSGGETFLASLSVAIGISEILSEGKRTLFLLDEGFGTLDAELIDTVVTALERLSQKCLVGVITHVDALIERMPYVTTIENSGEGSRII